MVHIARNLAAMMWMESAQENACRYYYDTTRAKMRILEHAEKHPSHIERDVQLADFNEREPVMP